MSDELTTKVIDVIVRFRSVSPEKVTPETTFESLGMDSLDGLSLICELEEEFNVAIPNDEAIRIRDVSQAAESLRKLIAGDVGGAKVIAQG